METLTIALTLVAVLFLLLGAGVWIAISLFAVGIVALGAFTSTPPGLTMANQVWGSMASWTLTALPLFVWMGEILFRSRLAEDLFRGLAPWLSGMPGQLLHVNVVGSGIFAAFSGSSSATCATIGKIAIPELSRRGYPRPMMIGSLAGSATLGLLIPPSIIMIVYGVAADVSIAKLFIAGIVPGLLLMALFSGYIAVYSLIRAERMPRESGSMSFIERLRTGRFMIPVLFLIVLVIGSIYAGLATATEAAALGVSGALFLSWLSGSLSWRTFIDGLMGAMLTSVMIMFIVAGAAFLTTAMGFTGIPRQLVLWIGALDLGTSALLAGLMIVFLVLGCFIDGISIVLLTTAVLLPLVEAAGIDLIWFGVFMVIVVEMSMITPPVGFNLFVLQAMTGQSIGSIAIATLPFFLLMIGLVVIITLVPQIVMFLPGLM